MTVHAQSLSGEIVAVDAAAGTISVSVSGGPPKVYRTRPTVDVTLNATKGKLADLSAGMAVKVTSGEPGMATRLEASGEKSGGTGSGAGLEHRLIGTTWLWSESKDTREAITFKDQGKASSGARPRPYKWSVAGGSNRIEGVTPSGKKFHIIFDADLTKGRLYLADERPRDIPRVTK